MGSFNRRIFLGYDLPLIEECTFNNQHNKYSIMLPVILRNIEWGKTLNQHFRVWDSGYSDAERELSIKFPISHEQLGKLEKIVQEKISLFNYGFHHPNYIFIRRHYLDLIEKGIKFLVPSPINNESITKVNLDKIELPKVLIDYIKEGNAKILFYQDCEGFLNTIEDIDWFESFIDRFSLKPDQVIVESANYKLEEVIKKWETKYNKKCRFSYGINNQFEEAFWFTKNMYKQSVWDREEHYKNFHKFLNYRRYHNATKHFMCLARRFSAERAAIFHKIYHTPILRENCMYSLLNPYGIDYLGTEHEVKLLHLSETYENTILEWFKKYFNYKDGFAWDRTDQYVNWAGVLPEDLHRDSFVNIVIETHQRSKDDGEIFLSEKTFRAIYTAQPFVIFGNPGTLKLLKKLGYKTFDDCWDESYDEPGPMEERLNKLFNTMESIVSRPLEYWKSISIDIENRLIHNFNVLMDLTRVNDRHQKLYEYFPQDFSKTKKWEGTIYNKKLI